MAHLNDLYEQQAKALLTKLCDALGIEHQDRTKVVIEMAIAGLKKPAFVFTQEYQQIPQVGDEEAEIERH